MDGRPNRMKNASFSNSSGVASVHGARNCLVSALNFIGMQMRKINRKKWYSQATGFIDFFLCFYFAGNREC